MRPCVLMLPDRTSGHVSMAPVGMRNPAHTGKMIATVDNIAGGRVIPGFGSGWMAREFSDFGMPFVSTRDRLRQLEEGLQIFRGMFDPDQDEFSFNGEYFHTENLVTQPKPPRDMPILVGGGGEQVTMRIAAQYADIWNNSAGTQDDLEHKVSVLHGHAERLSAAALPRSASRSSAWSRSSTTRSARCSSEPRRFSAVTWATRPATWP